MRTALKLIERGKLCETELSLCYGTNAILEERIVIKDSIIYALYDRLSIADEIQRTYKKDSILFVAENSLLADKIMTLNIALKKQKRKTFIARMTTVIVGGIGAYLILKP